MSGIIQRLVQMLASEAAVQRLARSKAFQQAAMKTHEAVQGAKAVGGEAGASLK
eukprot:CAMPEP_0205828084 /NCGR_PEP_ID=MMETSP0206-20130828/34038_1 /ASSEMBLY_ACC=CAM_ASM_000279 /TAXON_ID=36767 /ORGANISM="Euplotes focardii, Strain TN1" /LENGTH=53 /DNA_ID=CAMNT_0053129555 /DNA_START=61 /DNA_END=219 /DNA_ORIENTATION=+